VKTLKTHGRRIATGGIVAPLALLLATMIANEGQTLLGLHLDQTALAVYLVPFLLGAAHILNGLLKVEGSAIVADLGAIAKEASELFGSSKAAQAGAAKIGTVPLPPTMTPQVPPAPPVPPDAGGPK
jgi:hypothetical protein